LQWRHLSRSIWLSNAGLLKHWYDVHDYRRRRVGYRPWYLLSLLSPAQEQS
jgi:hypothetical protein